MGKTNKRDNYFCQGSVENRVNANFSTEKPSLLKKSMKNRMYFSDPLLIPRINQYLSDNKDKVYIDINDMVSELQSQYREYGRRKRNAFKPLVEKAFSFVLQQCGLDHNEGEGMHQNHDGETSENSSSDVEECNSEADEGRTSSNSQLINLYNVSQLRNQVQMSKQYQAGSNDNAELIDLSSDDENPKKKDGSEEKGISSVKLNNLQSRIGNRETTLTVVKPGAQSQVKVDRPTVTITAKRNRTATEDKVQIRAPKKKKIVIPLPKPITFADFGGDPKVLEEVCKLALHISHPEIYKEMGVTPPRGFLLHGPPGCGKTLLATAIAGELEVELIHVSAPELVGGVSGESEERIRDLFERAVESTPCILFIDEVDAICPNRENAQREMERRIVAQLLTCLDDLNNKPNGEMVLVIGATNRPDSIDPALRRAGRFDREVCLGIPDAKTRKKILKVLCSNLNLAPNFSFEELAQTTPGFVGADLLSLSREAATVAVNRVLGVLQSVRKKDRSLKPGKQREQNRQQNGSVEKCNKEEEAMEVDVEVTDKGENSEKGGNDQAEDKSENKERTKKEDETEGGDKTKEKEPEAKLGNSVGESNAEGSKEMKMESEEEIDVEVIADNVPDNEPPTLETLLYWLRDSSPLPHRHLKNICISQDDFREALKTVQPSSKREGFATVPDVTWDDVGSLADVREELQISVLGPVKYRKQFEDLGLSTPAGILICGPPGCGKTLLAKAVANEAGINFISVKGPELLNMYVGESERAVRRCFQRARNSAPCVIFFDELDALCPKRSDSSENGATMRVVNQLLTEMDGIEDRKEVYLMAATNRPDMIDPAVLRPGRLDKVIYVGLPKAQDRVDILRALTKSGTRPKLSGDVNLESIAVREECDGFSGADLAALIREAGVQAVKELMTQPEVNPNAEATVCERHFETALKKIRPSVNAENRKYYESLKKKYARSDT